MPNYEYRCGQGHSLMLRRSFADIHAPADCLECGGPLAHHFAPTTNIHVPLHFKAVRRGGVEGGYSWSDFHGDLTEKDLAHLKDDEGREIHVAPANEARSRRGMRPHRVKKKKETA